MEHFRSEIEKILNRLDYNVPAVVNGKPVTCKGTFCDDCDLHETGESCGTKFMRWLMSEYKEEPVLTAREKHFVEFVQEGWITRDKDGNLYWYEEKPIKCINSSYWGWDCRYISFGTIEVLSFITWEDEEPWSVEELRKLKVKDEHI